MNLDKLKTLLVEKIKLDYKDDISIVHVHGSYIYNNTHDLSDLDIYMLPKTDRGYELGTTFILEGVGTDLWVMPWERIEAIANHQEAIASILTEGEIIYYCDEEDLTRFRKLQEIASNFSNEAKFIENAQIQLDKTYKTFFNLLVSESLSKIRCYAIDILYQLSFSLAQLNKSPIKKGRKYLKEEILNFKQVPNQFEELYDTIFISKVPNAIKDACRDLLLATEELIQQAKKEPTDNFKDTFSGWFEELIQCYNKIDYAYQTGDIYNPLYSAAEIEKELGEALERAGDKVENYSLPNLLSAYDANDLERIYMLSKEHKKELRKIIEGKGVLIREFSNFSELESFMQLL